MKYTIDIDGYFRDCKRAYLPNEKGLYFVFSCKCNCHKQELEVGELLYIGCTLSQTIKECICAHEQVFEFESHCKPGEGICYACSILQDSEIQNILMIENAIVYAEQPSLDISCKQSYNYTDIEIQLTGEVTSIPLTHFAINNGAVKIIK